MKHLLIVCLLIVFQPFSKSWAAEILNKAPLKATAHIKEEVLAPGANFLIEFDLSLAEKHHAYSERFKLELLNPKGVKLAKPELKGDKPFYDKFSKKEKMGIEGRGQMELLAELDPAFPIGEQVLKFQLTYQACTEEYCLLPIQLPVDLTIIVNPSNGNVLAAGDTQKQTVEKDEGGILDKAQQQGWIAVFAFVFVGGLLTSFTPCIFPIIPITLAVIGNKSQGKTKLQGATLSLAYVLGIAITYALLGVAAARTGSLFGGYLGHPAVTLGIAFVFFAMAASMFGLYEIEAPAFIRDRYQNLKTGQGYGGAFLAGIIAGIIAGPCVGPVLVTILTYVAQTQNSVIGFFLLFTFAMGFGQLFLLLGTFSGAVNMLPKSGSWMVRVKQTFGVIMVAVGLYYAYPVVKPYLPSTDSRSHSAKVFKKYDEALLNQAIKDGKAVVIDFWADWCPACIELEKKTFSDSKVTKYSDKVVFLKYDATKTTDELIKLQSKYKIIGLPHIAIYDNLGQLREDLTLTGFESADSFSKRLEKALVK